MSGSTNSETWIVVDDEGGATGGGFSITGVASSSAQAPVTSTSTDSQQKNVSAGTSLTVANLVSLGGPVQSGSASTTSDSVTSSAFYRLDNQRRIEILAEILAMDCLRRGVEYRTARAEGRGARRAVTTSRCGTAVSDAITGSFSDSDTQSMVADFDNFAIKMPSDALNQPAIVAISAPPFNRSLAREVAAYMRSASVGTSDVRRLPGWQVLAKACGAVARSHSIPEYIRAIKAQRVNIYDVLSALESGTVAQSFKTVGELASYTFQSGKVMGKAQAKAKQMLKVFLKDLQ